MEIQLSNIIKTFGDVVAVNNASFVAKSGAAFGLLGRNGAGKTTTMRIIMDLFGPDSGNITVDNKQVDRNKIRFGYLPEERGLYPKMIIKTQLMYLAQLNGMSKSKALKAINKWLNKFDMADTLNKKLDTLSKGNQQKIQLASVLMSEPDIIILDEPFAGLDPVNASVLKDIIAELIEENKIVVFSSHQMSSIEEICNDIVIMDKGKIVLSGNLNEIKNNYAKTHINISGKDIEIIKTKLDSLVGNLIDRITIDEYNLDTYLNDENDRDKLLDIISENKFEIDSFSVVKPSLNDIFISATKEVEV